MIVPGSYEKQLTEDKVQCLLCPANCILTIDKRGICGSRFNQEGQLVTDNFGEMVSACYDPIEKKPLYHFFPGSSIFSTGPNGCNFGCVFCQNWEISQTEVNTRFASPDDLLELAGANNSIGIAYTYSEPLIWFEYILTAGKLVKELGLMNVLVSNGYINELPLKDIIPIIDAVNIDLKSMRPGFYKKLCKSKLDPVLKNIKTLFKEGVHLEITNLVITDENDTSDDFEQITDFIAELSPTIPIHFSAYHPSYKMNNRATSPATLLKAYEIASKKLDFVYLGNINLPGKGDTFCPHCHTKLITRTGYFIEIGPLENGKCTECGYETGIIQ
ncbi:MAG: AmmeMemoRadiSam system radical SAM enzyme [Candidatus Zixiibacteriota bacterium]